MIPADVAYPTDSGLLARAVGKLVRTARRVQAAGGAAGNVTTDRRRAAARRVREIAARLRARAKLSREESSTAIAWSGGLGVRFPQATRPRSRPTAHARAASNRINDFAVSLGRTAIRKPRHGKT